MFDDIRTDLISKFRKNRREKQTMRPITTFLLSTTIFVGILNSSSALLAFDCNSKDTNLTSISLVDVGSCEEEDENTIKVEEIKVSVYQDMESVVKVLACLVSVKREVFRCGMFSHIALVDCPIDESILVTEPGACRSIISTRILEDTRTGNRVSLPHGDSGSVIAYGPGRVDVDGKCSGGDYFRDGVKYEKALVKTRTLSSSTTWSYSMLPRKMR